MRISAQDDDPGYCPEIIGKAKVFLDGKELKHCVTADEELGFVLVNKIDDDGRVYLIPGTMVIARQTLKGNVRIELGSRIDTINYSVTDQAH